MVSITTTASAFTSWFTPRRLRFGFIIAAWMWVVWILAVAFGPGNFDLAGQVVGTDFIQFYSAGHLVATGHAAQIYDPAILLGVEQEIVGSGLKDLFVYAYPPFFAWVFVPLSMLGYRTAFVIWSLLGVGALYATFRMLGTNAKRLTPWALTFFPIFASVSFGQNGLLTSAILAGTYLLWRQRHLIPAGLVLSLMVYKPHLVLGVLILWALDWRRDLKALVGFGAGAAVLGAVSFGLTPEASANYIEFSRILPGLIWDNGPPVWHMHSVYAFFRLLIGTGILTSLLTVVVGLAASYGFWRLWKAFRDEPAILFAGAVLLTLCISPYVMVYDWAILVIPAALLWKHRPADKEFLSSSFGIIWITMVISGVMVKAQDLYLPFAFQPTVPVLLVTCLFMWKRLLGLTPVVKPQISAAPEPA